MGWEVHDGVLGGSSFFSQARIPVFSPVRGVSFHMELCRESQTGGGELLPCCDPVELEFPMTTFEQIAPRARQFLLHTSTRHPIAPTPPTPLLPSHTPPPPPLPLA